MRNHVASVQNICAVAKGNDNLVYPPLPQQKKCKHIYNKSTILQSEYTFRAQAQGTEMLKDALKTAVPIFDKFTEDGMCFRIYRLGSLEVLH